ncbi:hypothetical protein [Acetonema longum]|uniref:Uncharacterized protein n=1 Tax=Acetonema longum DSM 6540 TaxID=1009370 RepID=F7NJG2_9FIRM|nr:hypothetical protein [Acetonema longum]EGO63792.1 hypothetical protein ALO_11089 [Acetonema longum DSM 6540]
MIDIIIQFQEEGDLDWKAIELTPEDYFDLNYLDQNEILEIDSIPVYNHAIDYLKNLQKCVNKVISTKITIQEADKQISITEYYWNNQQNSIVERIDYIRSEKVLELIITSVKVKNDPVVWEIIRFVRIDGILVPQLHSFITDNPDGSQSEEKII